MSIEIRKVPDRIIIAIATDADGNKMIRGMAVEEHEATFRDGVEEPERRLSLGARGITEDDFAEIMPSAAELMVQIQASAAMMSLAQASVEDSNRRATEAENAAATLQATVDEQARHIAELEQRLRAPSEVPINHGSA